jgi:hypothetical protein
MHVRALAAEYVYILHTRKERDEHAHERWVGMGLKGVDYDLLQSNIRELALIN